MVTTTLPDTTLVIPVSPLSAISMSVERPLLMRAARADIIFADRFDGAVIV